MLKIRLQRVGRRNNPAFRVVVTESTRGPKSGDNVELLGTYNPHRDGATLNADRIKHWISNGAQVSPTVHNILVNEKVIEGKKKNVLPKKSPITKEEEQKEEVVEAAAEEGGADAPAEAAPTEETPAEEKAEDTPQEVAAEEPKEEAPAEEEKKEA